MVMASQVKETNFSFSSALCVIGDRSPAFAHSPKRSCTQEEDVRAVACGSGLLEFDLDLIRMGNGYPDAGLHGVRSPTLAIPL